MTINKALLFCFLTIVSASGYAQKKISFSSPDKKIVFELNTPKGQPAFAVTYKGVPLITNSKLLLEFADNEFLGKNTKVGKAVFKEGIEEYPLPLGKTSYVKENYSEALIPLQENVGAKMQVNLRVRLFNDGIGLRYELPAQNNLKAYILQEERTDFNLVNDPLAQVAFLENYTTSHEHRYQVLSLKSIKDDALMDMPALFTFPGTIYLAITEANLLNYAGMALVKKDGILTSQLSPLPNGRNAKVKAALPHYTPWRVMMISDRAGALIESNLLTNLAEPQKVKEVSWLKPGKATFHWWNGDVLPDTTFEAGINFNFNKYYIDFCARNNIEFHTIIGNRGVAWYKNDGMEYQPGPNTDVTSPRPGLDVAAICDYAKTKGVGIRFWVHWQALYPKLEAAFTLFEKWGIKGMMVDFMDRDDQEMVLIQEEILQRAAAHHLEIQFHGAYKPTGLNRTYPNESTREGTLNYENDKWGNQITADDDMNVMFTRALAGCTDYHLGGFNAMSADNYKQQFTKPHMLSTRCHMLAMYVVLENHMSMVCDYPAAYEGQPGFEFLQQVPTVWDKTVVPIGTPGEWIAIARQKGDSWYLAVITNDTKRSVAIPLTFLSAGNYRAEIYQDAADVASHPNNLIKEIKVFSSADVVKVDLPAGGGMVVKLVKE
jgi:alpha-glucosidase